MADSEIDLALARAVLYDALAAALSPPCPEVLERLERMRPVLPAAARLLEDPPLAEAIVPLAADLDGDRRRREFEQLFGHVTRGPVPPYETEYGEEEIFQQSQELADLAAFYRAFGLRVAPERHERPDHARCECEFAGFLCLKEAYALERGESEMLHRTRSARRAFLRDHLGRFGRAFGLRLASEARTGFYAAVGRSLARLVTADCAREGVPVGPERLRLRPVESLETIPAACGAPCDSPCSLAQRDDE
jgi:TorA maturation chaperone TorD